MAETRIEWATTTWNVVTGCDPVSEGCANCYAKRMATRLRGRFGYPREKPFAPTLHPERLSEPMRWHKPRRIFVCSMGDLFHEDVPDDFLHRIWDDVIVTPHHRFFFLTKRPDRMRDFICERYSVSRKWERLQEQIRRIYPGHHIGAPSDLYRHVWLGVTAENQPRFDERAGVLVNIPRTTQIIGPAAAYRFVSIEPMLGPIDMRLAPACLDWVICGGETGPGARPTHPAWVRGVRDQCQAAGVPFFMKQMSKRETIPEDLKIREFPSANS